uniref:Serine protease n=1 Tax=Astyanax mexicanus TaxID=7994 RepID=A0A8B9JRB8_ASTMX
MYLLTDELNDKTKLELSQNVRALKGHAYEICLPRGKPLKSTETSDTEQKAVVKAESSTVGDTESESREESTMTKSGKTDNQEKKTHKKSSNMPDFGEIYGILRSQFPELVKCMEARKPSKLSKEYLKLRKEDFVQSTRPFSTMCQLEKLVNVGTSVCTVKTANMHGTGFLLFDNFILTNAHVIEESYNIHSKKLTSAATVNFNMASGKPLDREFPLCSDVFAVWKGRDDAGRYVDFALLKLQDCEEIMKNEDISKLPRLLKEYTSNPPAGGICIIGHPGSQVKRMDVSCIVPHKATGSAPGDSSIRVSLKFSPNYSEFEVIGEHSFIATYNTCFLHGSSGSPVFDEHCKLVAMHTGGFLTDGNKEHIIEFGIPLHSIIKNIIKQLASREYLDVMFKFIETAAQNPHLEEYLKEFAIELIRNPSNRNAEMLVRICLETRNGMPNLSQMIYEALDKNVGGQHIHQIQQEINIQPSG